MRTLSWSEHGHGALKKRKILQRGTGISVQSLSAGLWESATPSRRENLQSESPKKELLQTQLEKALGAVRLPAPRRLRSSHPSTQPLCNMIVRRSSLHKPFHESFQDSRNLRQTSAYTPFLQSLYNPFHKPFYKPSAKMLPPMYTLSEHIRTGSIHRKGCFHFEAKHVADVLECTMNRFYRRMRHTSSTQTVALSRPT